MEMNFNGAKLRAYRESKHLSREALVDGLEISERYLADLERGICDNPSVKKLYPVCHVLGITIESLLTIDEDR